MRAKRDILDRGEEFPVLPILLHGDAAFAGQGIVAETLNLSQPRGYRTGGTIHLIVNNQVGFTTAPAHSRSSVYATDAARVIQAPILHVNGDDPEACVRAAHLAFAFRQRFHRTSSSTSSATADVGTTRPTTRPLTNPLMYNLVDQKRSVRKIYTEALIGRGDITLEEAEQALKDFQAQLGESSPRLGTTCAATRTNPRRRPPSRSNTPPAFPLPSPRSRSSAWPPARSTCLRVSPSTTGCAHSWSGVCGWLRTTRSTGPWPRRWRSDRCCWRAARSGWPGRTRGAAPLVSVTPTSSIG